MPNTPKRAPQKSSPLWWAALFGLLAILIILLVLLKYNSHIIVQTDNDTTLNGTQIVKSYSKTTLLPATKDAGPEYLEDILFLGDSNTVRLFTFELVSIERLAAKSSIGIDDITDTAFIYFDGDTKAYTIPEAVVYIQPRRIVMTFGTNNVGGWLGLDGFILEYREAAERLRHYYPFADIIVNTIPPIAKKNSYPNLQLDEITRYNKALLALCEEMGLYYINTAEALAGPDGYLKPGYAESDGIHLTQEALEAMLLYMRTHALHIKDIRPTLKDWPARLVLHQALYN